MNARIVGRTGEGVLVPITRIGAMNTPAPGSMVVTVSDTEPLPITRAPQVRVSVEPMSDSAPRWTEFLFGFGFLLPQLALLALVIYWQVVP